MVGIEVKDMDFSSLQGKPFRRYRAVELWSEGEDMSLTYKAKGGESKRIPAGSHIGVCDIVADIGLQESNFYGTKRKVFIRFEVPRERWKYEKDGQQLEGPGVIGNFYTASMHKKASLRKALEGWRGRAFTEPEAEKFDISSILGKACMLTVQESEGNDGNTYSNIVAISPLPKGMLAPGSELPLLLYHDGDKSMYSKLPEWIRKKIDEQVPEPEAEEPVVDYSQDRSNPEIDDSDIPF